MLTRSRIILFLGIIALVIGGYFAVSSLLFFSTDKVDLSIKGPTVVNVGEKHELYVVVINNSDTALQDVRVAFSYPSGTEAENNPEIRIKEGGSAKLNPGEKKTFPFTMIFTGSPGEEVRPTAKLSFRTQAVSLKFNKEAEQRIRITDLPLDVKLNFAETPSPGREFTFVVSWESKVEIPLTDIGLMLDTPDGYEFISSFPAPTSEVVHLWDLGRITPGATGQISIKGIFTPGATGGEFKVTVGKLDEDGARIIRVFKEIRETIRPAISSLLISQRVQGTFNPGITNVDPGEDFSLDIIITNTTNTVLKDVVLTAEIPAKYFEQKAIRASEDPVSRDENVWVFDGTTVLDLRTINPGAQKEFRFNAQIFEEPPFNNLNDRNPQFDIKVSAASGGLKLGDSSSLVRINGKLYLNQEIKYSNAPGGQNSGSIPPRVGQTTTYTVIWQVFTGTNGMKDVVTRAVFGPGVEFVAVLFPQDATLFWDEGSREVRWNIGDLPAGIGVKSEPREISFRISYTPRPEDVGKYATLISTTKLTGRDVFTDVLREFELGEDTTALLRDNVNGGKVEP